jgi:DNA-binding MarR family transcriptional regulator
MIKAKKMKTSKQLERYFKGVANHHRIAILRAVEKQKGLTLEEISGTLNINIKTASEHTRRLVQAGLLNKEYVGRMVTHYLTPYGEKLVKVANSFE